MVDFKDPNLWVRVRFNRRTNKPGERLRLYTRDGQTGGLVFKQKIGPPNPELEFAAAVDDENKYIIRGPDYARLLDYLQRHPIFVNCLGRIIVTGDTMNGTTPGQTYLAQNYFPWPNYGGPPLRISDQSSEVVDLDGVKVPDGGRGGDVGTNYVTLGDVPIEVGETAHIDLIDFSSAQIGNKECGLVFGSGRSVRILPDPRPNKSLFANAFCPTGVAAVDSPNHLAFLRRYHVPSTGRRYTCVVVVRMDQLISVDTNIWKRIAANCFDSKPGSIWSE